MNGDSSFKLNFKENDNKVIRKITEALLACLRPSFQPAKSHSYARLSSPVKNVVDKRHDECEGERQENDNCEESEEEKERDEEAATVEEQKEDAVKRQVVLFQGTKTGRIHENCPSDDLPFETSTSMKIIRFLEPTLGIDLLGGHCTTPKRQLISALKDPLAPPKQKKTVAFAFPDTIFRDTGIRKRTISPKRRSDEDEAGREIEGEEEDKVESCVSAQNFTQRRPKLQDLASSVYAGPVKSLDDLPRDILVEIMARLLSMEDLQHLVRASPICRRIFEDRGGQIFNGITSRDPYMHDETIQLIHLAAALRTGLIREYMPNLASFEISLGRPIDMFDERGIKEIYSRSAMRPRRLHALVLTAVRVQEVAKACMEYSGQFRRSRWELLTHRDMVLPKVSDQGVLLSVWSPEQRCLLSCWRLQVLREMYHAARTCKMGWTPAEHRQAGEAEVTDYQLFFRGFKLKWWWIGHEAEKNDAVRKELEVVIRCLLARMGFQAYLDRVGERLLPLPPKKGKGWRMADNSKKDVWTQSWNR